MPQSLSIAGAMDHVMVNLVYIKLKVGIVCQIYHLMQVYESDPPPLAFEIVIFTVYPTYFLLCFVTSNTNLNLR